MQQERPNYRGQFLDKHGVAKAMGIEMTDPAFAKCWFVIWSAVHACYQSPTEKKNAVAVVPAALIALGGEPFTLALDADVFQLQYTAEHLKVARADMPKMQAMYEAVSQTIEMEKAAKDAEKEVPVALSPNITMLGFSRSTSENTRHFQREVWRPAIEKAGRILKKNPQQREFNFDYRGKTYTLCYDPAAGNNAWTMHGASLERLFMAYRQSKTISVLPAAGEAEASGEAAPAHVRQWAATLVQQFAAADAGKGR